MKFISILVVSFCLIFSANSCKQCTTCTKYPAKDIEICKKDYASDDSYNDAYRQIVAQGYKCD